MNVKLHECKSPFEWQILFEKTNRAKMVALRSIIMNFVPTLAFHEIEIIENSTTVNDDLLGHMISMIPLDSSSVLDGTIIYHEHCSCLGESGCAKCEIVYEHKQTNSTEEDQPVLIDFKLSTVSSSAPLFYISKGQSLHFRAKARKGLGRYHTKWNPAQTVAFRPIPKIMIDPHELLGCLTREEKRHVQRMCPAQVFDADLNLIDSKRCVYCRNCYETSGEILSQKKKQLGLLLETLGFSTKIATCVKDYVLDVTKQSLIDIEGVIQKKVKDEPIDYLFVLKTHKSLTAKQTLLESIRALKYNMNSLLLEVSKAANF